jgi:hypothetical protein
LGFSVHIIIPAAWAIVAHDKRKQL